MRPFRGFTLIELLVVISIISILIAILLPALASAREASRNTRCLSNLRQMMIAQANYGSENKEYYPFHVYGGTTTITNTKMNFMKQIPASISLDSTTQQGYNCWLWLLFTYHNNGNLYLCPSNRNASNYGWHYAQALYQAAIVKTGNVIVGSDNLAPNTAGSYLRAGLPRFGAERFTRNKPYYFDGAAGDTGGTRQIFGMSGSAGFQHRNNVNAAFIGGHAKSMSYPAKPFRSGTDPSQSWFRPDIATSE